MLQMIRVVLVLYVSTAIADDEALTIRRKW
jgi:hypothetical protein